ncbi:hypothetical protein K449DRAFT_469621 [Hypoxylon sp. EC38]|nr:hypothetical protein K449DRAFT_469621 [Hypoxylon sp. EC38]
MDPNNTPSLAPPPGIEPNFSNPVTLQSKVIAVAAVTLFLCTVGISARIYTRAVILKQFDHTDCSVLLAEALFTAFMALTIVTGQHGQGRHQWDITVTNGSKILRYSNISQVIYSPTMFFAKYAVLRQIELIFLKHRPRHVAYKVIWALIWANLVFYTAMMISFILGCVPREKIWHPQVPGRCINNTLALLFTSTINVISDLTIFIVPLAGVWTLQLPSTKKLGAMAIFAVGIFAVVSSIVRLYYTAKLTQTRDYSWAIVPTTCWVFAEFTTVILVACFPSFPRLFAHLRNRDGESPYCPSHNNPIAREGSHAIQLQRIGSKGFSSTAGLGVHAASFERTFTESSND